MARIGKARASGRTTAFALLLAAAACGTGRTEPAAEGASAAPDPSPRVSRREQREGLERCGAMLERIASPDATPTFSRAMRDCSGLFSRQECRRALQADAFSRERVAEACRRDYCGELRPPPPFCTMDMPSDEEFLEQYARFARMVLRRDLRRVLDAEGAAQIADLFADLVEAQAGGPQP